MKTLLLIRHAKSSWDHGITDVARPLSSRGISDANLLSKELLKYKIAPNAVFSSPANRALSTCRIFMDTLNISAKYLTVTDELYDFGGQKVKYFIKNLNDEYDTVMIFGHNEAFTAISNSFGDVYIDNVPTCGFVKLQFDVTSWQNIDKGHTSLTIFPKNLKSS